MAQQTDPRRILTTKDHPISAALVAAGMLEVGGPGRRAEDFVDPAAPDTKAYPLSRLIAEVRPDVLVLIDPWRDGFGYGKGTVVKWAQSKAGHLAVGVGDDPAYWELARARRHPACVCSLQNFAVYVTNDPATAEASARERRTALWRPGESADHVVRAIRDAAGRQRYVAGPRALPYTA